MRPANAFDARDFGRRGAGLAVSVDDAPAPRLADDLKLFATTFLGGFLFVAVYLA